MIVLVLGWQFATSQVKTGKRKVGNENGNRRFEHDSRSPKQAQSN